MASGFKALGFRGLGVLGRAASLRVEVEGSKG